MLPQPKLILSPYIDLYDKLIPENHELRRLLQLVDFSFVYEELQDKYCPNNGRTAIDPIQMFKYLYLKVRFDYSDVDLMEHARYDLSYKFFLGLAPEDDVIHPSLLSKFRRQRLKDVNLLDMLLGKTVSIAQQHGLLKGKSILVDSVHTLSRYNRKTAGQYLKEKSKALRKSIYVFFPEWKEEMPEKPEAEDYETQRVYTQKLLSYMKKKEETQAIPAIKEKLNLLKEILEDMDLSQPASEDKDAKIGHKTADSSFYGYKSHLAMTEERIITGAVITSGEKNDGKYLQELIERSEASGYEVKEVIGDKAYSEKENLVYGEKEGIKIYAKLNKGITHQRSDRIPGFEYNKDAEMYVCPAGHMATSKKYNPRNTSKENPQMRYYFDVELCRNCAKRNGCYKPGAKTKAYTVKIKCPEHEYQMGFQETEEFQEKLKERYKIEAKNGELKTYHGYDRAHGSGLEAMELQAATTLFAVNMKRILKLMDENEKK